MHYSYGFASNGAFVTCHIHDCRVDDDPKETFKKWSVLFKDPRYKVGETKVLMHFDDKCAYLNFEQIQERVDYILQYKPAKLGVYVRGEIAMETAKIGTSFLRSKGVTARVFNDLDKLFQWFEI